MTASLTRAAFYARVSSEQQAQQGTIASQVAELETHLVHDGYPSAVGDLTPRPDTPCRGAHAHP